ncbi:TetR/AcrR family transcriptional regulator [Pseudochrobactrum algeriensis]|uniref:TetR/AcrR family transcriptional regulator n=1 Tax=Pseudochrobactrum algeriensis TaxID=2834768 RepID=UPI001BCED6A0|nr:TetR/AcrR family transcriptional regulator [Pseudochrobactrum algeriensis]MBX8813463.1 TetR/AcrR family transcriptional regulator [Ochrobactrum sp. MR34]QVQ37686.1 TetR/AcrR family transcriptional regulator [Pseudochrobactrum algeriensis]QVQ40906.1 TetR/AcrR family transcriptional regulator [Pseudochrobactrum algeriensis]QVQ44830.1 TetR/AcrR family transcriptional regulator [Pseudochrobactrum algeriensis]
MRVTDPEKHQAKKQMILEAAKACFAEQGFHQTSTAQICAAAGVSTGNLFHYFSSKKAIIAAIVEEDLQQTQIFVAALREQENLVTALDAFFDVVLDVASDPAQASLALEIAAEAGRDAEIGVLYRLSTRVMREELEYLVSLGMENGQFSRQFSAASVVHCLMVMVDGIFSRVSVDLQFKPQEQKAALKTMMTGVLGLANGREAQK